MKRHNTPLRNFILGRRFPGRVFISGTGRAGTTLLVQLLTDLGLNTGFTSTAATTGEGLPDASRYFETARAGLERDPFDKSNPFIVKSPFLCDVLAEIITSGIAVDHILIPIRKLEDAAESRRFVQAASYPESEATPVAGGLWGTERGETQDLVLAAKLYRLVETATRSNIPMTFMSFPKFADDAGYAFDKLKPFLPLMPFSDFKRIHAKRVRRDLIHDFGR